MRGLTVSVPITSASNFNQFLKIVHFAQKTLSPESIGFMLQMYMKTFRIVKKHVDSCGQYVGKQQFAEQYQGSLEIDEGLGTVRIAGDVLVSGCVRALRGSGIKVDGDLVAGGDIRVDQSIEAGKNLRSGGNIVAGLHIDTRREIYAEFGLTAGTSVLSGGAVVAKSGMKAGLGIIRRINREAGLKH
jgi:hypothetical protein